MFHDGIRVSSSEQNFQLVRIFFWSGMNDLFYQRNLLIDQRSSPHSVHHFQACLVALLPFDYSPLRHSTEFFFFITVQL